ncbi:Fur family transcriptional regulator [Campylobacter pinnipediorum subsp. pinnipediorum]|uniref:Fur family transcriptional regulator n=1 Tax=Campylobacter pinnipediorum subsp. pinnipediorum TaxID=1660067 RepID=A0AAX0LC72_9BACT|nr:transcriptional repressor [Campylobacter pinnipediorum]OPA81955.1 Fur family transcriptional regulator [Campylobacter pinnipediorum subsp. pinnipediorum]
MEVLDILKKTNIRITPLRLQILDILSKSAHPMAYDEILSKLKVNKTTVYRSLELFEKHSLVIKSEHDRKSFYELGSEAKAYFVCDICHKITNIEIPNISGAKSIKSAVIKGICNSCS